MSQQPAVEVTRHGTFIGPLKTDYTDDQVKLLQVLTKALEQPNLKAEKKQILQEVDRSVRAGDAIVSKYVNDEGACETFTLSHQEWEWLARHDQSRWPDYLVYRYKFRLYPTRRKLENFPPYLLIEPSSVCNLRCVMCFQSDETFAEDKSYMGVMPWELFTSLVDQAKEHECHAITLASRGEPTMHRRFGDMLKYMSDAGVMDIKINTNATRLKESVVHDILSADVSEVVFSVDAGTKETYEAIRRRGVFDHVVANIDRFNEIRAKQYPKAATITRIAGVQVNETQDLQQMGEFWSERVDHVTIKTCTPRWDSYNNPKNNITEACSTLWSRMYVWYDGIVNPCDFDYKSYLKVGDANKNTLSEIWLGEQYTKLRENHANKNRSKCVPCDRCPVI